MICMELNENGNFFIKVKLAGFVTGEYYNINEWIHVAFRFQTEPDEDTEDTEGLSVIVNGAPVELYEEIDYEEEDQFQGNQIIRLGESLTAYEAQWIGGIHGAALFKEALSEEEICEMACATRPQDN